MFKKIPERRERGRHEFCGVVGEVGPAVKKVQKGKQYVASFQIPCRKCFFVQTKIIVQKVFAQTKFSIPPAKGSPELTRYHD
jgi:threonine dehydrogenase-like Zn-dependent dehydrogenase